MTLGPRRWQCDIYLPEPVFIGFSRWWWIIFFCTEWKCSQTTDFRYFLNCEKFIVRQRWFFLISNFGVFFFWLYIGPHRNTHIKFWKTLYFQTYMRSVEVIDDHLQKAIHGCLKKASNINVEWNNPRRLRSNLPEPEKSWQVHHQGNRFLFWNKQDVHDANLKNFVLSSRRSCALLVLRRKNICC